MTVAGCTRCSKPVVVVLRMPDQMAPCTDWVACSWDRMCLGQRWLNYHNPSARNYSILGTDRTQAEGRTRARGALPVVVEWEAFVDVVYRLWANIPGDHAKCCDYVYPAGTPETVIGCDYGVEWGSSCVACCHLLLGHSSGSIHRAVEAGFADDDCELDWMRI